MCTVFHPGTPVKWKTSHLSPLALEINLQFSSSGVIHVITRAKAGKEMNSYDELYHRF